ncbi:MAG TPA: hypothetical protein VFZ58_05110 [Candidatus Saccharimonadales bacterium]
MKQPRVNRIFKLLLLIIGVVSLLLLAFVGYVFFKSPAAIRFPQFEHAHFRMQLLVNGKAENFGHEAYQASYKPQQCSDELTKEPIHFHDKKDQFVHLHWKKLTGGMVLKYYGWNKIGGLEEVLGYRFDGVWHFQPVPIYGSVLPALSKDTTLYVYSGDETHFKRRDLNDFLLQDVETFFNKASNVQPEESISWFDALSSKVIAHDDEAPGLKAETTKNPEKSPEELTRINNLLGNVVLFAQKDEPTQEEIKARFAKLVPLSDSTCGG